MQGGPLSPLLSNIVLDELDQELEKRGLEFCRFTDDCNIFVKSQKAAERVMDKVSQFIEKKLKLKVNREKSQVAKSNEVKFLGFTVVHGTIAIPHKALKTAMSEVKALTPRGTHQTLATTLDAINQWYVGWSNYYCLTYYPSQLKKIEAGLFGDDYDQGWCINKRENGIFIATWSNGVYHDGKRLKLSFQITNGGRFQIPLRSRRLIPTVGLST